MTVHDPLTRAIGNAVCGVPRPIGVPESRGALAAELEKGKGPEQGDEDLSWQFSRSAASFATADKGWTGLVPRGLNSVSHGVWRKDPQANPAVLYTEDGGITWEQRTLPGNEWYITSLCLLESDHGLAAVWNGFVKDPGGPPNGAALYETSDAGRIWTVALEGKKHVNALFALDASHIWAAGDAPGFAKNDLVAILATRDR